MIRAYGWDPEGHGDAGRGLGHGRLISDDEQPKGVE